ncbi:MAG TPA: tripartite tricarboxylate transporter substrate-binding protein [Ramlibacter sp.]|nr:tripartite tricarboxylate transporter substrate-binding protein [Ramlibacter sp.]
MIKTLVKFVGGIGLALTCALAAAQHWPNKPVKFIVPTPAGTAPDIVARVIGEKLTARWGQQVVVENRAGAGGIPAMVAFSQAAPDGHTLGLIHTGAIALTPHLFKDPKFNVDTDIVTVSTVVNSPLLIAANPKLGIASFQDLVNQAKAKPGKLVFAAPLLNSVPHLAAEMLSRQAGIQLHHVPYNGSAASITATVAGDGGDITIDAPAPLLAHVKAGKLKAVAVTSAKRLPGLEDIPTVGESLRGFEANGWFALFAPARTPAAVLERINGDVAAVLQQPEVVARFAELGLYTSPHSVRDSAAFISSERAKWAKVIKDAGIRPE